MSKKSKLEQRIQSLQDEYDRLGAKITKDQQVWRNLLGRIVDLQIEHKKISEKEEADALTEEHHTTLLDKSPWPHGPWCYETDQVEWRYKGLPCVVFRIPGFGTFCGYVGVNSHHPWYESHYDSLDSSVIAHGGLTFSDRFPSSDLMNLRYLSVPSNTWWLGFDCMHAGDLIPTTASTVFQKGIYRDINFAKKETNRLADQIIKAGGRRTMTSLFQELGTIAFDVATIESLSFSDIGDKMLHVEQWLMIVPESYRHDAIDILESVVPFFIGTPITSRTLPELAAAIHEEARKRVQTGELHRRKLQ